VPFTIKEIELIALPRLQTQNIEFESGILRVMDARTIHDKLVVNKGQEVIVPLEVECLPGPVRKFHVKFSSKPVVVRITGSVRLALVTEEPAIDWKIGAAVECVGAIEVRGQH